MSRGRQMATGGRTQPMRRTVAARRLGGPGDCRPSADPPAGHSSPWVDGTERATPAHREGARTRTSLFLTIVAGLAGIGAGAAAIHHSDIAALLADRTCRSQDASMIRS